jgi:hypothetical protein
MFTPFTIVASEGAFVDASLCCPGGTIPGSSMAVLSRSTTSAIEMERKISDRIIEPETTDSNTENSQSSTTQSIRAAY